MMTKKPVNDNGVPAAGPHTVGYGNPPKHAQFQKGKSGNPNGRPKALPSLEAVLQDTFNQKVTTTVNGKLKKMSAIQAVAMKALAMALGGNQACMNKVFELYAVAHPLVNDNQPLTAGSSFQLTPEDLAAIAKSNLLKGVK